jgi:hypothetical protein
MLPATERLPSRMVIEVIDPEMAAVLRSKSGAQRLQIANGMFASARRLLLSHLRAEHPAWSEQELQEGVAGRLLHRTP